MDSKQQLQQPLLSPQVAAYTAVPIQGMAPAQGAWTTAGMPAGQAVQGTPVLVQQAPAGQLSQEEMADLKKRINGLSLASLLLLLCAIFLTLCTCSFRAVCHVRLLTRPPQSKHPGTTPSSKTPS